MILSVVLYIYCSFSWRSSMWTGCSVTCGSNGHRQRHVHCHNDRTEDMMPDHYCRPDQRPLNVTTCDRQAPCAEWILGPWHKVRMGYRLDYLLIDYNRTAIISAALNVYVLGTQFRLYLNLSVSILCVWPYIFHTNAVLRFYATSTSCDSVATIVAGSAMFAVWSVARASTTATVATAVSTPRRCRR